MFDTHCHLNFKAFKKTLLEVIDTAHESGVTHIVIPGTDVKTSRKGVEIAQSQNNMYSAVGIHPHHVYKLLTNAELTVDSELLQIEDLLVQPKVVAVGEIGMDRHEYKETVYEEYNVDGKFLELQKELFEKQVLLAIKHNKSLILHNREASEDLLPILSKVWDSKLEGRTVLHCCEAHDHLLQFAQEHHIYLGVDGDITYSPEKQEFIKKVPLEMLVLETDSPFLLPEPLKSQRQFPNNPANIKIIAETVAKLRNDSFDEIKEVTSDNAKKLFQIAA